MALGERSVRAKSYSGNQVGILTDGAQQGRIQDIQLDALKSELGHGRAGGGRFQGVDMDGNVTGPRA